MEELLKFSDPYLAQEKAYRYLGNDALLYISDRKNKKYMIKDPNNKWVHFGDLRYIDWTRSQNEQKRQHYLKRTAHIKGDWAKNKDSPNNLSRAILWNA